MGWSCTRRRTVRHARRPKIEALEIRSLLSASPSASHVHATIHPHHARKLHATPHPTQDTSSASVTNFDAIDGASQARATYGVDGTGMTVAVIDTGVDYTHEALGRGFGPGHKVIAGFDFSDNNPNPMPAPSMPHGTAVAGLIGSSDPAHPGVAPGTDIVALRVFSNTSQGDFTKVADALQWVIDHHSQYNITAVNISISDGNNYAQNWFAQDDGVGQRSTMLIGQLDALKIPVVAATGNSFNGQQGEGFPSIVPDTISVSSTDANDQIVPDAQRLGAAIGGTSATDLAAPGLGIIAPSTGNGFSAVDGTSFAAPQVTGAVVLLQQIYKSRFNQLPTVSELDNWLQQGSDPTTGITIGRLDIPKAASLIPNPAAEVLTPPPASGNGNQGPGTDQGQAATGSTNGANSGANTSAKNNNNSNNNSGFSHASDGPAGGSQGPQTQTQTQQSPTPPPTSTPSTPPSQSNNGSSGSSSSHSNSGSSSGSGSSSTTSPDSQRKLSIFIDGKSIDQVDRNRLGETYAQFVPAFQSFLNWGTSPGNGSEGETLRIWTARQEAKGLGASQPTGVVHVARQVSGQDVIPLDPLYLQGQGEFVRPRRRR
jgi:subtilisin family serine protease